MKYNPMPQVPAVAPNGGPPSRAEVLGELTNKALAAVRETLDLELPDPGDPTYCKVLNTRTGAALAVLSLQLKIDREQLRPPGGEDPAIAEILRRVAASDQAKTIEAAPPAAPGERPKPKAKP